MTISYKKLIALHVMLLASVSMQAMEIPKPKPTKQELTILLVEAVDKACKRKQGITSIGKKEQRTSDAELNTIKKLLKQGADANAVDYLRNPLLFLVTEKNDAGLTQLLLNHRASVDVVLPGTRDNELFKTPLDAAAVLHNNNMIILLLNYGASVKGKAFLHFILGPAEKNNPQFIDTCVVFLRHPHMHAHTIKNTYQIISQFQLLEKIPLLNRLRLLTYHADKRERLARISKCIPQLNTAILGTIPPTTIASTIAAYAGCYHHAEDYDLLLNKTLTKEDREALADIGGAVISTSEKINKAVLEKEG